MTSRKQKLDPLTLAEIAEQEPIRVAVVVARYNEWITRPMQEGAVATFEKRLGDAEGEVTIIEAAGAFELPALVGEAAGSDVFHAVVALGCVIKGETSHDQVINQAVSNELARIAVDAGVPVGFGLLTVDNAEQAEARAGGAMGNKGAEAMDAALDTLMTLEAMRAETDCEDTEDDES